MMDNDALGDIVSSIEKRECVFFVGAGMSIEAGLPSGKDLAKKLFCILESKGYSRPDNFTLPRLAEDFEKKISRLELEKTIRQEIIESLENCDDTSYKLLAKLQPLPKDIITTNYDRLLESSLGEKNFEAIFNDSAVSKISNSKTNLFKIHGDIHNLEKAIITETDIREYEEKYPSIWNELMSLFQKRAAIFLGFSMEDEHIRHIYKKISEKLGKHMPKSYVVCPDNENKLRIESLGARHIQMTARDFLEKILSALDEMSYNTMHVDIPAATPHTTPNHNPFSIYSTEYFPLPKREELINETFIEPINFAMIVEPGNTIIEGHRGSGKSMVLKYLSYEAQCERNFNEKWDKTYVGIYLKFKESVVNTTKKELFKGNGEEWVTYFMTYVNLLIGEEIIRTLKISKERGHILLHSEKKFVSEIIYQFFDSIPQPTGERNLKNLLLTIKRTRNQLVWSHSSDWILPADFLENLMSSIKDYINEWSDKELYILLDEYDNLDDEQQRVVNTLIKNRSFSYKVGVKLFEMIYEDIGGKILEKNNDYVYVTTDRFDFDRTSALHGGFKNFARNVANRRLKSYGYNDSIEELLPGEEQNRKGFEKRDYSGFNNIVKLSSGIIRDFLELCKDMVYYSNPEVSREKKDELEIIPPNIQNTVIRIHSNLLYENIKQVRDEDEEMQRSRSDNTRILIDSIAGIFQNILKGSHAEYRTVSGFQLRNIENLSSTVKKALKDATYFRLLQVPYNPRAPQNPTRHTPHERYKFHRLLCPRFRLSLAERWPKEIDSETFNDLLKTPKQAVQEISSYFIKNVPPKTKLTGFINAKNDTKPNNN